MATPDALIGDRYRLVRELGSGGMSVVWEARDERLGRRVAVKQFRRQPGLSDEDARTVAERAMREARINARLQHPHAVAVFDAVEYEGGPCLVMEAVSSRTLADALRESGSPTMEPLQVARVGSQVASALAAAHGLGIVHRDIKPSNILLGGDGRARISDFGISRTIGENTLTMTGMISGTPAYLAPEVARGGESTTASDVFSLGATLYASVEGDPPFGTDGNVIALLYRVAEGTVPTPRRAGELAPLLGCMLARDPTARPAMAEVAAVLTQLSSADSGSLSGRGTDVSTVAIPAPTGVLPVMRVGTALGAGGAAADTALGSTAPPRGPVPGIGSSAALFTGIPSTTASSAGHLPATSHGGRRRRLITAGVAAVVLVAAVAIAVAGVLWPRTQPPGPAPGASALANASQQPTEDPAGTQPSGQQSHDTDSGPTNAADQSTKTNADEEPATSSAATETSAHSETSKPTGIRPAGKDKAKSDKGNSGKGNDKNGNTSNGNSRKGNSGKGNSGKADRH